MAELVDAEELMLIKKENLETGMRGYPVGYCITSSVDPQKGLSYGGRLVSEMAEWNPLRVIYLLYNGRDGKEEELNTFYQEIKNRSHCSDQLIDAIYQLPRSVHPMKLFTAALLLAGGLEGVGDYREDCLNLVAKIPIIAAATINHHAGWGKIASWNPEIGYMDNFAEMLNVPGADKLHLTRIFKLFNVLHYDHGGGNLSCFIGKGVASGLEDLYGSLAAAMCALSGPRHGKANQDCLEFVRGVLQELGEEATAAEVAALIEKKLASNELIFGFGHAVLRVEDPRATILYREAEKHYSKDPLVKMALLLRSEGPKILSQNPKISNPYPNVDAISGTVLAAAGFPYPEYFTLLFGLSRCVGVARQIVYERLEAREGKGTPIIRPKYYFKPLKV